MVEEVVEELGPAEPVGAMLEWAVPPIRMVPSSIFLVHQVRHHSLPREPGVRLVVCLVPRALIAAAVVVQVTMTNWS